MTTRTVHIVGLDVSLASTGVAVAGCTPRDEWTLNSYRVQTKPADDDHPGSQLDRMERIGASVAEPCARADLVLVEGGAFATRTAFAHVLAGCWWVVFRRVRHCDRPVIVVPPTQLKKYATGRGRVDKGDMGLAIGRMWPNEEIRGNDAVDAVALASLGADLLDLPVPWARTKYRADVVSSLPRPWEGE